MAEVRHAPNEDPARLITSYDFDARGNVVGMVDPSRNEGRGVEQAVSAAADPAQRRTSSEYNDVDELVAEVEQPTEPALEDAHTEYRYDANGNRTEVVSPRGFTDGPEDKYTTRLEFDHRDQVTAVAQPTGAPDGDATFSRTEYLRRCDCNVLAVTSPRAASAPEEDAAAATDEIAGCRAGGDAVDVHRYFTTRYSYDAQGNLRSRSVPFAPGQYGRSDEALQAWKVTYTRNPVGNPTTINDARGNSFANTFYDTGDLKTTERPSWWRTEWGQQGYDNPQPGERYGGGAADADIEIAVGGPTLIEREGAASDGEGEPDLPSSVGEGNFAKVDTQPLPGLLPKAGTTAFEYNGEMQLTAVEDVEGQERVLNYDPAGRIVSKSWPFKPDDRIARLRRRARGPGRDPHEYH